MDKNILLVFLLMAVAIFGAQFFMRKNAPPQSPSTAKQAQQQTQPASPAQLPAAAQAAAAPAKSAPKPAQKAQKAQKAPAVQPPVTKQASSESEIVIENDLYRITFTNRGALVKSWILKRYRDDHGKPLDLVNSAAAPKYGYPLSLWTYDENLRHTLNSSLYLPSTTQAALQAPARLTFEYSDGGGLVVRKTFSFDHSYVVGVDTSVVSGGSPVYAFPAWPSGFGDETNVPAYASSQLEYQFNDKIDHTSVKKISGGNTVHGTYDWIGAGSQYFTAVFIPDNPENLVAVELSNSIDAPSSVGSSQTRAAEVIGFAAGHPGQSKGRLFVGPKALAVLESVKVPAISGADKDLRGLVNFGFFGLIARPLFIWLRWTNEFVHNWGWSIVLQTIIITLALLPLRVHQLRAALKMQRVQPQMKAIQEKYKKYSMRDPRKQDMNKEVAELYKREKVNPVGGCLPMLIQLPFLYAYYRMLDVSIDLRQAHWLWIKDLSAPDPYMILPILLVISMFLLQKMTPQAGMDPAQQRMMNIMMPVVMGFLFFRLAAGLNLYYGLSNLIMIGQTAVMNRTELGREMRELAAKRARKKDK
jgi:YidC/Oxa1 family membrane protein insertase